MNYWLSLAKSDVSNLGFQVLDSSGAYATSYSFFDTLQKYNPDVIIADGHGDPSTLTGQGLEEVLKACTNNQILSGKIVCAVSCLTGQNLGPDSRNKNVEAYIGFVNEFSWAIDPANMNPATDQVAYCFQEIIRKMVILVCQHQQELIGLKDLYNNIVIEFDKWIKYYSVPPGSYSEYASDILLSLIHDKTGVITLGKAERYAYPTLPISPMSLAPTIFGALTLFGILNL